MTIEWKDDGDTGNYPPGATATVGDLDLSAYSCRGWDYYRAYVQIETEEDSLTLAHDKAPTLEAAKLACERFAREWIAAQAGALGGGWISCEERMPEDARDVLVLATDGNGIRKRFVEYYRHDHWTLPTYYEHWAVTHWAELPALPEVK